MTQQNIYGNANDITKRRLLVEVGSDFVEVKGRIIEPYSPPTPQPQLKELKLVNAPSHFHHTGITVYKAGLNILFRDRQSFHEYVAFADQIHKYYDERGNIFVGALSDIKYTAHEALNKYKVDITLLLLKKDWYETTRQINFQDLDGLLVNVVEKQEILELANVGLLSSRSWDGESVLYFRPLDYTTRAELAMLLNSTRRYVERLLRK